MRKILIINASARKNRSISRYMTNIFVEIWEQKYPDDNFIFREVGQGNIPHISELWIAGAFKPSDQRNEEEHDALKISQELVKELKEVDVVVIGTPMYNWSIPSALKAYIDQILRVNETVLVSGDDIRNPYKGLLKNKQAYIMMVRGNYGYDPGDFYEHMDYQTKYLKTVFGILGIKDVEHVALNGAAVREDAITFAKEKVEQLFKNSKLL